MSALILHTGLLLNLILPVFQTGPDIPPVISPFSLENRVNQGAVVTRLEGTDVMSGPEETGVFRRLHLPAGFVTEIWEKEDDKIFVWSKDLDWGGWAAKADFQEMQPDLANQFNRFGQAFSAGLGDKITLSPSVSISNLENILKAAGSPAILEEPDFASFIYKRSFFYNIDPVYLLAFFKKESSMGLAGATVYTKNIGNIRCTAGYICRDGWRKYSSWKESAEDWFKLILDNYVGQGLDTVGRIVYVYAPPFENDTKLYINQVNSMVARYRAML